MNIPIEYINWGRWVFLITVGFSAILPDILFGEQVAPNVCSDGIFPETPIPEGDTRIYNFPLSRGLRGGGYKVFTAGLFCISENEISVDDYQPCVDAGVCPSLRGEQLYGEMPVHSITYEEIEVFLTWLNSQRDTEYRLPTEAEWQRAASMNLEDIYPWRDIEKLPSVNIFSGQLNPINQASRNDHGLRDTVGNVAELVFGCFDVEVRRKLNDVAVGTLESCKYRLAKGGHYSSPSFSLSPFFRMPVPEGFASPQIGFRLARSIERKKQ